MTPKQLEVAYQKLESNTGALFTNNLLHIIDINTPTTNAEIEIRLNDCCKNGHEDFAITATFWKPGKPRTDRFYECGGCCHDEILALRPDLAPFVALHLCDFTGAPMYAAGNGLYHAKPGQFHAENAGPESLANYFRIPVELAEKLCIAEDAKHMAYLIELHGINKIWKKEAKKAISLLENLTGKKFKSTATRLQFERLTGDERKAFLARINAGFYTPEQITARAEAAKIAKIEKFLAAAEAEKNKKIKKAETQYQIKVAMCSVFGPDRTNYIYYDHTGQIKFNWLDYEKKFSADEIKAAMSALGAAGVVCDLDSDNKKMFEA